MSEHDVTGVFIFGNTDNKLTQQEWADLIREVRYYLGNHKDLKIQFSGHSTPEAPWQNFCVVVNYTDKAIPGVINTIETLREKYRQDSVAYIQSTCMFV